MSQIERTYTLDDLATLVGGEVVGCGNRKICGVAIPEDASRKSITVAMEKRVLKDFGADIAILAEGELFSDGRDGIMVGDVRLGMARLLGIFENRKRPDPGISESAIVSEGAVVASSVSVGPFCVVEDGAHLSENVVLEGHVYVGRNVKVDRGTWLEPMAVAYHDVSLGKNVLVHSGAVLGCDGFGIIPAKGNSATVKIPQIGNLVIEDDVEIGACSTIDRGTIADTVVGRGTKIDNHVHIGHNVRIGNNCVIVAMTGVAGSAVLEDNVIMAARSGASDHARIGRGATVAAQGAVVRDVPPGAIVSGFPARDHRENFRVLALTRKLPTLYERVERLERSLAALSEEED